jgi:hypothetical protein
LHLPVAFAFAIAFAFLGLAQGFSPAKNQGKALGL